MAPYGQHLLLEASSNAKVAWRLCVAIIMSKQTSALSIRFKHVGLPKRNAAIAAHIALSAATIAALNGNVASFL